MITDFSKYRYILVQASLLMVMVEESFPHVEKEIHLSEREFYFFSELFKKRKSDGNNSGRGWVFKNDITITVEKEKKKVRNEISDKEFEEMEKVMWRKDRLPDKLRKLRKYKFKKSEVSFSDLIESKRGKIRISPTIKGESITLILLDEKMEGN